MRRTTDASRNPIPTVWWAAPGLRPDWPTVWWAAAGLRPDWPTVDWLTAALFVALLGANAGCKGASPPFEPFAVELDVLPPGKPVPNPPPKALEAWRVWVNQEQPRQKKNPKWVAVPGRESRILDMAADGRWRCIVNPVRLRGQVEDDGTIETWLASRTARCSSDGWKTHVESPVHAMLDVTGKVTRADAMAPIFLNDVVDGQPRRTIVLVEPLGSPPARSGPPPR